MEHVTIEDVFCAYYDCRKSKRRTLSALRFELNYEIECYKLWKELNDGTYEIGSSIAFCVTYPKLREVFAADFRDRIVHHLIVNKFNILFENEMLETSFACRKGKGTLYGVRSIQESMKDLGGDAWYAKCDIEGFFMSIDRNILYEEIGRILRKNDISDYEWWMDLIGKVIMHRPERKCIIRGNADLWNGLPKNKSLFHSNGRGLPIGNLTSQVFANIYLSIYDRWVVRMMGEGGRYGRYVDDFVIIHKDKEIVKRVVSESRRWLADNLGLSLHPRKVCVQQVCKGLRFTGTYVRENCLLPSRRLTEGTFALIGNISGISDRKAIGRLNSRVGLMVHCNSFMLRRAIWKKLCECSSGRFVFVNNRKFKIRNYGKVC